MDTRTDSKCEPSRVKYAYQFLRQVARPAATTAMRTRAQTSAAVHARPPVTRLIARAADLAERGALNFIVISPPRIARGNKDNKAMRKTVELKSERVRARSLNFRLRAVTDKQTWIFIILT